MVAYTSTLNTSTLMAAWLLFLLLINKKEGTKMGYVNLKDILGKDKEELTALRVGEFETEKLGTIPYTAIDNVEYKDIKKECLKFVPDGTGGVTPEVDDDRMMIKIIVAAVHKDKRSDFTFVNRELIEKLEVVSAEAAVGKLLEPGEIYNMAVAIQNISGFGPKAKQEIKEEIKNS